MDAYEPLEVIGSGSFGMIRKVRRKSDGKILARKEIDYRKMSDREKRQLVAEVNILRELRHPNVVRYYERFVDRSSCLIYIIMEYCEGGDLAAIIKRCKKEGRMIPEHIVWNLCTQLILALHECHHPTPGKGGQTRQVILHRDLKPDNVLLDADQNIKLGDFGLSRVMDHPETDFAKTYVGTPFYMSPELVTDACYNAKSDIWALGCLIYELCALEPPFQAKTQAALTAKIRQGKVPELPKQYSNELKATIKSMLQTNHLKRPSTVELLKLDRVRLCVRERELNQLHADLKRREAELVKREEAVAARETAVVARERKLQDVGSETDFGSAVDLPNDSLPPATRMSLSGSLGVTRTSSMDNAFSLSMAMEGGTPANGTPASLSRIAAANSTAALSVSGSSSTVRLSQGSAEILEAMRSPSAKKRDPFRMDERENRRVSLDKPLVPSAKMSLATATSSPMAPSIFRNQGLVLSGTATPSGVRPGLRAAPRHLQNAAPGSVISTPLTTLAKQMNKMTLASPMQMSP